VCLACAVATALAALGAVGAQTARADPPFDQYYPQQIAKPAGWLTRLHWDWDLLDAARSADVAFPTVAVVDSGIDAAHLEYADEGTIDAGSADCSTRRAKVASADFANLADPEGHGTKVAGLAAAPANGVGIVGVSPFSTILAVRINPGSGLVGLSCALSYLARQMDDAGSVGLLVVNLSLSDPNGSSPGVRNAIRALVRRGALVVAATGNKSQTDRLGYPAKLQHVLAVGDMEGKALLRGPELDLLAPGGALVAPQRGTQTAWETLSDPQTSWATALASGAAAAVWGAHPSGSEMTAQQLAYLLRATASGGGSWNRKRGFGAINIARALAAQPPPADDEVEPNDSAPDAAAPGMPRLRCAIACTRSGILGATDDREDWWAVAVPSGKRACVAMTRGPRVRAAVVPGGRGLAYVRVKTARKLASYSFRVRLAVGHC
jgi:hypothetical protein